MSDTTTVSVSDEIDATEVRVVDEEATVVSVSDTETVVIASATIGPRGPQGVAGIPGVGLGTYQHTQNSPALVWTIQHNLGSKPGGITVLDADGQLILGWTAVHASENVLVLTFPNPEPGTAYVAA